MRQAGGGCRKLMGWLHEHKAMGQGRPPDDALQASLVSAADPEAAGDNARLGLLWRALDQGQEVGLWPYRGSTWTKLSHLDQACYVCTRCRPSAARLLHVHGKEQVRCCQRGC